MKMSAQFSLMLLIETEVESYLTMKLYLSAVRYNALLSLKRLMKLLQQILKNTVLKDYLILLMDQGMIELKYLNLQRFSISYIKRLINLKLILYSSILIKEM